MILFSIFSNFVLMIDLILDHLKSTLKSRKCQTNYLNMVIDMTRAGSHDHWITMKQSHQSFVDTVKNSPSHWILSKILIQDGFKWQKIFVFVEIVVIDHINHSFFPLCFLIDAATKLLASIRQCEIIVRDANRIHHVHPNGQCSCNDYF